MVSLIESNYMGFGSGIMGGSTGVMLQNRGAYFSLDPAHPNALAPGARTLHTLMPGMLLRDGRAEVALGAMGGDGQPQTMVQLVTGLVDDGLAPQALVDRPRWVAQAEARGEPLGPVSLESDGWTEPTSARCARSATRSHSWNRERRSWAGPRSSGGWQMAPTRAAPIPARTREWEPPRTASRIALDGACAAQYHASHGTQRDTEPGHRAAAWRAGVLRALRPSKRGVVRLRHRPQHVRLRAADQRGHDLSPARADAPAGVGDHRLARIGFGSAAPLLRGDRPRAPRAGRVQHRLEPVP